jgi:hypothetical protein
MALTQSTRKRTWNDKFTKITSYFIQETADPVSVTKTPGGDFRLVGIRFLSDGAITSVDLLTIAIDANAGAGFDHTVFSNDMNEELASGGFYAFMFDPKREYARGDKVTVAFPNTEGNQINIELLIEEKY